MKKIVVVLAFYGAYCFGMKLPDLITSKSEALAQLHDAVRRNNYAKAEEVLRQGILDPSDLNEMYPKENGRCLLVTSLFFGEDVLPLLLKYGADPDVCMAKKSVLTYACERWNSKIVTLLLNAGAHPSGNQSLYHLSPLMAPQALQALLDAGASGCPDGLIGFIVFHYRLGSHKISDENKHKLRLLFKAGVSIGCEHTYQVLFSRAYDNNTALLLAPECQANEGSFAELLEALCISYGRRDYDVANTLYAFLKEVPHKFSVLVATLKWILMRSIANNNLQNAERLLQNHEIASLEELPEFLGDLLEIAVMHDYKEMTQLLIDAHASTDKALKFGNKKSTQTNSALTLLRDHAERLQVFADVVDKEHQNPLSYISCLPQAFIQDMLIPMLVSR